jgi:sarcosine oxidase gamma subunit
MPAEPTGAEPPAWGTPDAAPVPRFAAAPVTSAEGFAVLVEQTTGSGDNLRWTVHPEPTVLHRTRDDARRAALDLCRALDPSHPFREQHRSIFRVGPDEYLVVVTGMTKTFHFRVTVAERLS